jgi:Flp pilus assembly protein TadD
MLVFSPRIAFSEAKAARSGPNRAASRAPSGVVVRDYQEMGIGKRWLKGIHCLGFLLPFAASVCGAANADKAHFVGPEVCALCHKEIAAQQSRTAMATTWQGPRTSWLPPTFNATVTDDLPYELTRSGETITYSVDVPVGGKFSLPVGFLMGGRRHGIGFLIPIWLVDGMPLASPALIQARYAWSPEKQKLLLAPGCAPSKPQSLESAFGLVLSPTFASRCLSCHGQPNLSGSGKDGGVHCEGCHGPGSGHFAVAGHGNPRQGIVNPKRLSTEENIAVCAKCHVGLEKFSDPSPDDLLVANQVRAIQNSECFLQSRNGFSCTLCHDPHNDAAPDDQRAVHACLGCHAISAKPHAAVCPVNATAGCIECHMPSVEMGPLHLVDHVIRVHPEQKVQVVRHGLEQKTQIRPVSEYLRMITTTTAGAAASARDRIRGGESFYKVARELSVDQFAAIGGYLGRKTIAELSSTALSDAAARLGYGETSQAVESGGLWIVLQRLPRDFRWNAEELQRQAEDLAARGDALGAIGKAQEALMIYPQFLRAISFIGIAFTQSGNPKKGAEVLGTATRLYPQDAGAEFALASALELLHDQAGASNAYQQVIALEPDFTAAYVSLGMISYANGDWQSAITTFRQGLHIDPLSADLNYDLGLALTRSGDAAGGNDAIALARKLDAGLHERAEAVGAPVPK